MPTRNTRDLRAEAKVGGRNGRAIEQHDARSIGLPRARAYCAQLRDELGRDFDAGKAGTDDDRGESPRRAR